MGGVVAHERSGQPASDAEMSQVSAPLDTPRPVATPAAGEAAEDAASTSGGAAKGAGEPGAGRWRASLHVQGAVAVEGEATLWKGQQQARTRSFFSTSEQQPLLDQQHQVPGLHVSLRMCLTVIK